MNVINALSVDVEEYFQVEAFSSAIKPSEWNSYPSRVQYNTKKVLDILDSYEIHATFFCLGWVAKKCPDLIKEISERGHEVASHGFSHKPIWKQTPEEFRVDVRETKRLLEDITGKAIIGYRAPTYSITLDNLWVFEILSEEGYVYDSSIFPIKHDLYGIPYAPRFLFKVRDFFQGVDSDIIEIPLATVRMLLFNFPVAGGGYFRLLPFIFIKAALLWINLVNKKEVVFYIHPWEFDPDQPRVKGIKFRSKFRHYINLHKTHDKFKRLLSDFNFDTIATIIKKKGS